MRRVKGVSSGGTRKEYFDLIEIETGGIKKTIYNIHINLYAQYLLFLSYILVLYIRDIIQYSDQFKSQTLEAFESGSTTGIRLQLSSTSSTVQEVEISEYRSATVEKNRAREREKR